MNENFRTEAELVSAIRELPKGVSPERDLWPEISDQLAEPAAGPSRARPGFTWPRQALAAALVIAFGAGILLGRQLGDSSDPAGPMSAASNLALVGAMHASEREYQAAFRQFIPVGNFQSMLGPQAVDNIAGSWSELQQAETALLAALEEHPENAYLNQRLLGLRAQQLQFMKQLATLDQFSRRNT